MGIMHKLFKRRNLDCQALIMDLTKSKDNTNECANNRDIHEHDLVPKLATDDNQFTAEHIVQLCKFLAEKSKRNKIVHKRLSLSPNRSKTAAAHCQRESNLRHEHIDTINQLPYERLHVNDEFLLEVSTNATQILSDKCLLTNANVCEELNQQILFSSTNKQQRCAQEKRDILLKIRHQIFERKRQRQLMEQQLDVWRPW